MRGLWDKGKDLHFLVFLLREKERRGREHPTFSILSSEFRRSKFVERRVKVHLLDECYVWVPKKKGFTKDPKEKFLGNQRFWAKEASHPCNYALRGRDSSYFVLFSPYGQF